ncbi:MAG: AMP-binding protein, partial [Clostridia bacterium]
INRIGAIANIVHPLVRQARLQEIVEDMQPKMLVLFDEFFDKYLPWIATCGKEILLCSACDYLPFVAKQAYGLSIAKKRKNAKNLAKDFANNNANCNIRNNTISNIKNNSDNNSDNNSNSNSNNNSNSNSSNNSSNNSDNNSDNNADKNTSNNTDKNSNCNTSNNISSNSNCNINNNANCNSKINTNCKIDSYANSNSENGITFFSQLKKFVKLSNNQANEQISIQENKHSSLQSNIQATENGKNQSIEQEIGQSINHSIEPSIARVSGDDIAVFMHSGGTTGKAKTVLLTNSAFNHLADNIANIVDCKASNRDGMLMVLPIFHTFGLGICMHTSLAFSMRIVLMPKFQPKAACRLVKKYGVTFVAGVPNMYRKMIECGKFHGKYLAKIRECYVGGDRLDEKIEIAFEKAMSDAGNKLTLSQGYGLTEACVACVNSKNLYKKNSIGKPIKGNEFAIIDEQGNFVAPPKVGMIVIASDQLMTCYFDDEKSTKEAFFLDEKGKKWLKTGDIGYMDKDGYVFFVDRAKRLIKISGMNVFPQEIENLVSKLEFVENCCLVKKMYDNKTGTLLFVALKANLCYNNTNFDAVQIIRKEIARHMLKYYMPQEIRVVDTLPLTQIGKVDYKKLEEKEN